MAINLENIDENELVVGITEIDKPAKNKDVIIIVGKDVLLKIFQQKTPFTTDKRIKQFIDSQNLLLKDNVNKIERMVLANREIKQWIEESIKQRDSLLQFNKKSSADIKKMFLNMSKKHFSNCLENVLKLSKELSKIQQILNINISVTKQLYFCKNCKYIDELMESRLLYNKIKCPVCKTKLNEKDIINISCLNRNIESYLDGVWLEDYMAKIFHKAGWKVWSSIYVLGISGINHEIDLLAIKNGYVIILERKTGKKEDQNGNIVAKIKRKTDIFNLSIKNNDTKSNLAYLVTLYKFPSNEESISFIKKTAGLNYIDDIIDKTDEQMVKLIKKEVKI